MSEIAPRYGKIERGTLWAGGWDNYLVDLDETVDCPPALLEKKPSNFTFYTDDGRHWLMCWYMNMCWDGKKGGYFALSPNPERGTGIHPNTKGVRILRHLGGGD